MKAFHVATAITVATLLTALPAWSQDTQRGPQPARTNVLAPARPDLEPVPLPELDTLEPAVAAHLREARADVERAAESSGSSRRQLSDVYGAFAQTLHAYEFLDAADASYRNASRLAPGDARWLHLRGYLCQQSGLFEDAADLYAAARRAQPDDHVLGIRLGEVYLALGRLDAAREEFEAVLARYPAAARAGLGEVALRQRRFDEAAGHFRGALERVPQAAALHYSLAMTYRGLGRVDDARAELEKRGPGGVTAADPMVDDLQSRVRGERALVMKGRRLFESGELAGAADAFRAAIAAAPDSIAARINLGLTYLRMGNRAAAIEPFEAVLVRDPANLDAHARLGALLADQGRDAEAVDHLRPAFGQSPGDEAVRRTLVAALVRLDRKDEAIRVLTDARAVDASDEGTLVTLSILLADRERYREAIALLDDADRRDPNRQATTTTLARLLAAAPDVSVRDGARALTLARRVYDRQPLPVHAETVALALAELGRCAEAADWMQRGVRGAKEAKDDEEATRLLAEAAKYEAATCRPAGK